MIQCLRRSDEVTDGVYNDSSQGCIRDVEEKWRKGIDGEEDDKSSDETGQWCAHTSFRLDRRPGEATCSRISAKERADKVGNANGNEL